MNGGMIDHDATYQLAALRAGTLTAQELMAETLDRIDKANPAITAIVALRDRNTLLAEAERAPPGPLQGLPMAIKDLAETAGIVTTYGSPAFRDHVPAADSPMVTVNPGTSPWSRTVARCDRTRSATTRASSMLQSGRRMTNSSPPNRAMRSRGRTLSRSTRANTRRARSPVS